MFTLRERIVASEIWPRLWIVASYSFSSYLLYMWLAPSLDAVGSPAFCVYSILAVSLAFVLTTILSPFISFFVFSGIADRQSLLNGGPFSIGDRVAIISGRNTGRYATVTSFGQCKSIRITIDGDAAESPGYAAYQLKCAPLDGMQLRSEVGHSGDG